MKAVLLVAAALQLQSVLAGHFSVRMPFANPAGVTYITGPAPVGLAAGPAYAAPAPVTYAAHAGYAAPHHLAYAAHAPAVAAPLAYAAPAVAAPVHYATPHLKTAVVPTVHHVPAVQDVPYTRYEATPTFVQKLVDVAKPAVATRRFQIRRPAIQKQFYDIEERVVVRPAGSALVELDQPTSKTQKGETVISTTVPVAPVAPVAYAAAHPVAYAAAPVAKVLTAALPAYPALAAPVYGHPAPGLYPVHQQEQQQQQQLPQQEQPQAPQPPQEPQYPQDQAQDQPLDDDSIQVSNPDITSRAGPAPPSSGPNPEPIPQSQEELLRQFGSSPALRQLEAEGQALEHQRQQLASRMARLIEQQQQQQQDAQALEQRQRHLAQAQAQAGAGPAPPPAPQGPLARQGPSSHTQARFLPGQPGPAGPHPQPAVEARSLGAPIDGLIPAPRSGNEIVPSLRNLSPEQTQENQQRLIQLLTAQVQHEFLHLLQGGVAEVGSARAGPPAGPVGDAGQVRARVLSATPAPEHAPPTGERVQTRRVVVSRPIETLQEIDVVEPFTKIHRLAVQQPALIKTARVDVARIHTSVPVYGKALQPVAVYH